MSGEKRSIIVLDGGMGQELRRRSTRPASPMWSAQVMMDEPELVTAVHRDFIAAGARVITVNAYSVTPERLEREGRPDLFDPLQQAALAAARTAREQSGEAVRIAGCLPPLVASYRPDLAPDYASCLESYRRIVAAQVDGVDLFMCETMPIASEARAATVAAAESGRPVWTALTVSDADGRRLRSGEEIGPVARMAIDNGAEAVLVNCSLPEAVGDAMSELAPLGIHFGAYANGFTSIEALQPGGTVDVLEAREDLDPAAYAEHALGWVAGGACIVGGCCEVGPDHIAYLVRRLREKNFRCVANFDA